jgi:hypothetical protein
MARFKDREEALILRRQGMSYSQIKKILRVSKGTLSVWLEDYPLSKQRIRELRDCNEQRIEKYRETMRQKRETRLNKLYKEQKALFLPLKKRDILIAGLFLYWGEGSKTHLTSLSLSNTDPSVIRFFIGWLSGCLGVLKERMKIQLQLYSDMDIDQEINFWTKNLGISRNQFTRPYIKQTSITRINHKGGFGHGTCNVKISDARLAEKILMAIKVIADRYTKNSANHNQNTGM